MFSVSDAVRPVPDDRNLTDGEELQELFSVDESMLTGVRSLVTKPKNVKKKSLLQLPFQSCK